jgi:hypothetical protein
MGQVIAGGEQFETNIVADHRGQIIKRGADSGEVDAFGRRRVSEPFTLFDSTLRYSKLPEKWNETIVGSATSTHLTNESSVAMTVTASGDSVTRRTRQSFPYQPGKSLQVMQSFKGATLASGLIQEVGYFSESNGVLLRASGTTLQFVQRSYTSGSVVETIVNQDSWNIDAASWLNFDKANIFTTDLEWLGTGRVRVGFIKEGEFYYCHEFHNANSLDSVYMTTAVLPLTYRIEATGAAGGTMKQICSTVISEAGYEPKGIIHSVSPSIGNIPNTSGERIVAGIRMASGRTDNIVTVAKVDLVTESQNDTIRWRLRRNPTTSGFTWSDSDNGRGNVQTTSSGTIVSGGTIVDSGLFSERGSVEIAHTNGLSLALGVNEDGSSETLFLTVASSGNTSTTGLLGWRELL